MYCIKCGFENKDEAIFCLKCGAKFEETLEDETVVAKRSAVEKEDEEREIFSIRPTLKFVWLGYFSAIVGAFFLVALFSFLGQLTGFYVPAWASVLAGLSLLLIPAYFHLRKKMVLYTLTDSKVAIDEGLVSRTTRNVPLRIIQDVTVSANVFQRLLGFGNLEIENANEGDPTIILRNIDSPKEAAEELLDQMRRLSK